MNRDERARTGDLSASLEHLLPALERFLRFDGPDVAGRRSEWLDRVHRPLPSEGWGADAVLDELRDLVIARGSRIGASGFCGWVTTMPTTVPAAAAFAGSLVSPQRWWVQPGNSLEVLALRWLGELVGLPASFGGTFTSGGSVANLLCLGAARQRAGEARGVDVAQKGIGALVEPRVYAGDQVHHVALRALGTLGLGRRALCRVPSLPDGSPDLRLLEEALDRDIAAGKTPIAIIASAGDVNMGTVDPIDAMRELAHARGTWLHVDGAYGGFGVLDERVRERYGQLAEVDSFAIDPHKWLAVPIGCGAAFVREPELLDRAFALEPAAYVSYDKSTTDPGSSFDELGEGDPDRGLDHSAPPRGLVVWAALAELGVEGMRARVGRHLDCARRVASRAHDEPRLEVLREPVLSICCFRYRGDGSLDEPALDALNDAIVHEVRARGRIVPSHTTIDGKFAIRPCFIGPRSGLEDADAVVDEVLAVAAEIEAMTAS